MKQFSPIVFDFVHATVEFHHGNSLIILKGGGLLGQLKETSAKNQGKQKKNIAGSTMFLIMKIDLKEKTTPTQNEALESLLE